MAASIASMEQNELCEIEATVATGFETIAKEEIVEKLDVEVLANRGKVNFNIPITKVKQVLELSSIDNAYVVIQRHEDFVFANTVDDVMNQFRSIVPDIDWKLGLKVWRQFFHFDHPVSPDPKSGYQRVTLSSQQSDTDPPTASSSETSTTQPPTQPPTQQSDTETTQPPTQQTDTEATETAAKKAKTRDSSVPAFRATCYRSGKHIFPSPEAACHFGGEIQEYFGWNVDMKKFDIEVVLTIERSHVYVSLALTRESLHRRNIMKFGPTTLRPTIAYNILRFCHIKELEVVCDPMCGGGSIPVEAAINWPRSVHLCGDSFDQAPPRTKENIDEINRKRQLEGRKGISATVFRWDACKLPLKDEAVDVFVTDMPFGKRSGSRLSNWSLYPRVLTEMARVCKRETGRVCLLTQDRKCLLKSMGPIEGLFRRGPSLSINMGGLAAGVFLFFRTAKKYLNPEELAALRQQKQDVQTVDENVTDKQQ